MIARNPQGGSTQPADAEPSATEAPGPLRPFPPLQAGQRVALMAPSSHQGTSPPEFLEQARQVLQSWGLRVDALPPQEPRHLYLAGPDFLRAEQFRSQYLDPEVKALFCTRGGYGSARMLPLLPEAPLAQAPPKAVVGFSDVTALFAWLHTVAGVQTVHGPCLAAPGALSAPRKDENLAALRRLLFEAGAPIAYQGQVLHWPEGAPETVTGRLLGGCLSVLATSLGTPWSVDTRGAILLLEDVDEPPYRLDRLLTHLRAAGKLSQVRAVVWGGLLRCDSNPPGLLEAMLRDVFADAPYPVLWGLPCGHGELNLAVPLGALARVERGDEVNATLRVP